MLSLDEYFLSIKISLSAKLRQIFRSCKSSTHYYIHLIIYIAHALLPMAKKRRPSPQLMGDGLQEREIMDLRRFVRQRDV